MSLESRRGRWNPLYTDAEASISSTSAWTSARSTSLTPTTSTVRDRWSLVNRQGLMFVRCPQLRARACESSLQFTPAGQRLGAVRSPKEPCCTKSTLCSSCRSKCQRLIRAPRLELKHCSDWVDFFFLFVITNRKAVTSVTFPDLHILRSGKIPAYFTFYKTTVEITPGHILLYILSEWTRGWRFWRILSGLFLPKKHNRV